MIQDFWSVIWDNDVRVIVMLTAESEGGQLKCHPYWRGDDFGPMKLRVLSEKKISLGLEKRMSPSTTRTATTDGSTGSAQAAPPDPFFPEGARRRANTTTTLDSGSQTTNQFNFTPQATGAAEPQHVILRKFALSHAAHPFLPIREITQLHYPSWPDFGAPAQPSHLLALVELANVIQRGATPVDVPGTLSSATVPRHNGDITVDGAGSPFFARHGADRGSSAVLKRVDSEGLSLSWHDGPELDEHTRPMLVHCSAGCGRTGAFCTVDSVIDMLKRQRRHVLGYSTNERTSQVHRRNGHDHDSDGDTGMAENNDGPGGATTGRHHGAEDHPDIDTSWLGDDSIDLIAQTVEDFRGQRLSTVQSLRQFVLCYETVLEWIRRLQESGGGGVDPRGRMRSGSLAF